MAGPLTPYNLPDSVLAADMAALPADGPSTSTALASAGYEDKSVERLTPLRGGQSQCRRGRGSSPDGSYNRVRSDN